MAKATPEALEHLHAIVAKTLADKLASNEASASDIANAIKFLRDNGIEADLVPGGSMDDIRKNLPDFDPEEIHH